MKVKNFYIKEIIIFIIAVAIIVSILITISLLQQKNKKQEWKIDSLRAEISAIIFTQTNKNVDLKEKNKSYDNLTLMFYDEKDFCVGVTFNEKTFELVDVYGPFANDKMEKSIKDVFSKYR